MWLGLTTSDWLGIASMFVAVVGFGYTIAQVRTVRDAVRKQAAKSASAMLLANLAHMERIERDTRQAAATGDHALVERAVLDWRAQAADARGLLPVVVRDDGQRVLGAIDISIGMTGAVLERLGDQSDLPKFMGPLLAQIATVVGDGRTLATSMIVDDEG